MTIRQIAEVADVSVSTVSLALRDDQRVSVATRELVRATAKRMNHQPRRAGRPLRRERQGKGSRRANRVGFLVAGLPLAMLNAPVYMDLQRGVEAALSLAGKMCVLRHLDRHGTESEAVFPQKVDGVIVLAAAVDAGIHVRLAGLPFVRTMGVAHVGTPWDHVTYDNPAVGQLAADYLLDQGHRHLAMIAHPEEQDQPSDQAQDVVSGRRQSFQRRLRGRAATLQLLHAANIFDLTGDHQRVVRSMVESLIDQLQAMNPRPTGLFCPHDLLTAALYPVLAARGIQVGVDLQIISCNNEQRLLQNLDPCPATIDIHAFEIGRQATRQLLWRMEHPGLPTMQQWISPSLVTHFAP